MENSAEAKEFADRAGTQAKHAAKNSGRAAKAVAEESRETARRVAQNADHAAKAVVEDGRETAKRVNVGVLGRMSSDTGVGFLALSVAIYAGAVAYGKFRQAAAGHNQVLSRT